MNSLANDYGSVIDKDDTDTYVKMANSFINDEDAVKDKVCKYFTTIPKKISSSLSVGIQEVRKWSATP